MYLENRILRSNIRNDIKKSLVITEPSTSLDIQEMFRKGKHKQTKQVTLYLLNWLSEQERRVDALALRADERRDKLR